MKDDWCKRIKKMAVHSAECFVAGIAVIIGGGYLWFYQSSILWVGCIGCLLAIALGPLMIWGSIENAWEAYGDYRWERKRRANWSEVSDAR